MKKNIDNHILLVGDFNTPLTVMDRSSKQKINRERGALNDTLDQMVLTDIYTAFHPNTREYSLFVSAHGRYFRRDHILGHKSGLNRYQEIWIIPCLFSDHEALKLEITVKSFTRGKLEVKSTLLNNEWVNKEIKEFKIWTLGNKLRTWGG